MCIYTFIFKSIHLNYEFFGVLLISILYVSIYYIILYIIICSVISFRLFTESLLLLIPAGDINTREKKKDREKKKEISSSPRTGIKCGGVVIISQYEILNKYK